MKHKDLPVYAILDFLYIIVSGVSARLLSNIVIKIIDLFVALDFFTATVIRVGTLFLFSFALMGFFAFMSAYREGRFDRFEGMVSASAASLLHFLIGMLFAYTPWLYGATRHIAGFLTFGINYNDRKLVSDIPLGIQIAVGFVTALLTVVLMVTCRFFGFRKRLFDREALTGTSEVQ